MPAMRPMFAERGRARFAAPAKPAPNAVRAWPMMFGAIPIALLSLFVLLMTSPLARANTSDPQTPSPITAPEQSLGALQPGLRLAGQGTLRMLGFRIYEVRLFVTRQGLRSDALTAFPFALDLRYAMSFKGTDIARRTREEMEKLGRGSDSERQAWELQLAKLLPDVRDGDHLTGLYRPASGTTLLLNGRHLADIPGDAFARAFFAIWLDPRTTAPSVRTALLLGADAR